VSKTRPLYVTRPLLPPLPEVVELMEGIWSRKIVTNCGPLHERLEAELRSYLGVPTASLFNNATIALMCALKLFNLPAGSEVITTPLTFAATAHSISWNGLKPVFVDVLEDTLTIDPDAVRLAITPNTSAILAVHVYGTVCEIDELQDISRQYGLPLLYDAAHAFGVEVNGRPIASFGDASVFSFHATKLFTTLEGGMIATPNEADYSMLHFLRNFGIKNEEEVLEVGLNGKMNEVQAAIGLRSLALVGDERASRAKLRLKYELALADLPGITLQKKQVGVTQSEQYFPVLVDASRLGRTRDQVYDQLKQKEIMARKYFHPICTDFIPYKGFVIATKHAVPVVERIKASVLCLPFFSQVTDEDVDEIADTLKNRSA
jgi:dTDP-4-amino-4,6-dideoxygalactose transaminase